MTKKWHKKERRDAKKFGGRITPRSGGLWGFKGDVKSDKFLIESKHTDKKSFSVTQNLLKKLWEEGLMEQRIPILSVELGDGKEFVCLDKNDFIELITLERTNG